MTGTPRTDALLTELSVYKNTTSEQVAKMTKILIALTRELERENNNLRKMLELFHITEERNKP